MRRVIHRTGYDPRVEMAPLLDVIFLLLTFFIYSMVVSVRTHVLPVKLPAITSGQVPADTPIAGITVDVTGQVFLNQKPIERSDLESQLKKMTAGERKPAVFIALEAEGGPVDRGPLFVELIDMMRRLGIEDFHIVGREKRD